MHLIEHLFRADSTRFSRVQTSRGDFCVNPIQIARSLVTAMQLRITGVQPELPWLPWPVISFLERNVSGHTIFEFGGGASTGWFAKRASRVVTVEHDQGWARAIRERLNGAENVEIIVRDESRYADALGERSEDFDFVIVDGIDRLGCLVRNAEKLRRSKCVVIDNTDQIKELEGRIFPLFRDARIDRVIGYAPAQLHPNETTIVIPAK